ncbi:MAG: hypothetical protein ACJ73N_05155 [Bryobacteraceae bacterium]
MLSLISRCHFALGATAASCSILTSRKAFSFASTNQRVKIDLGKEVGIVRPELHGQFGPDTSAPVSMAVFG